MTMYYSNRAREQDPHALPDIEVFLVSYEPKAVWPLYLEDGSMAEPGWYWWSCLPGCLPDGEPMGPYDTESDALADARDDGCALTEEDYADLDLAETVNKEFKL